jgi:hypothetical protein
LILKGFDDPVKILEIAIGMLEEALSKLSESGYSDHITCLRLRVMIPRLQSAIASEDPEIMHKCVKEVRPLLSLAIRILESDPGFYIRQ